MGGTGWLPRKDVIEFVSDKQWHNFAEILGACGDKIQHERATRLYMGTGAGRKKTENGRPPVALDDVQKQTGIDLAEIVRKGRRRGIQHVLHNLTVQGILECKDKEVETDLREFRLVDPPTERHPKKAEAASDVPPKDSTPMEPKPKKERRPRPPVPDEELDPVEPAPKVQFELPKGYRDVMEYLEFAETEFLAVLGPTTRNCDKNDFFKAIRDAKRVVITNVFAPAPQVAKPVEAPKPPVQPAILAVPPAPAQTPAQAAVPLAGDVVE